MIMSNKSVLLPLYTLSWMAASLAACLLLAPLGASAADESPQTSAGPDVQSVIAAEHAYAKAYLDNDADELALILADDWQVVNTHGGWGDAKKPVMDELRSGSWKRTALDISDIKVRVYGNVAVATEHLTTSGTLDGKAFTDIKEVESDVFVRSDGGWKCILSHETEVRKD
jgi:uncharacterized protein (TIGR02246 family)